RGHRHPRYCLIGNHEALFLEFFADPSLKADWLDVGGLDTLASYGISPGSLAKHRKALQELLLSHVPIEHLNFLNSLPVMISTPSHVFVHAGVRTELSLSSQEDDDLLWCKDNFDHNYEAFDKIVVHGHTPRTKPLLKGNRISIDTGAYMTGRLSAVCIARNRAPYVLSVSATASRAAANSPAMHV
ncbi:MAG TPA: hypothetical protein VL418_07880, partial [Devosiaceae bacterium]|nr:hypothetical protein [Devosiaceae bacterium]